jgi:hypothetical protein
MSEYTSIETKGIRGNGVFRYFIFKWFVSSTGVGTTTIDWELIGVSESGSSGGTALSTFTLKLNDEVVLEKNNETVYYKNDSNLCAGKGTKTIHHKADGSGTLDFDIAISKIWAEVATPVTQNESWELENNKPYSACYWGTNASVKINAAI